MIEMQKNIITEIEILNLINEVKDEKNIIKKLLKNKHYLTINLTKNYVDNNLYNFMNNILSLFIDKNIFELSRCTINIVNENTNKNDTFHVDGADKSIITYLNNNFLGGEFEYLYLNNITKIKPEKGLSIVLDSNIKHRVLPVINGTRYSLVCFFTAKENLLKKII